MHENVHASWLTPLTYPKYTCNNNTNFRKINFKKMIAVKLFALANSILHVSLLSCVDGVGVNMWYC